MQDICKYCEYIIHLYNNDPDFKNRINIKKNCIDVNIWRYCIQLQSATSRADPDIQTIFQKRG